MEEVKYIPGDLVMTNGVPLGTANDVVYRVTSSDPSKTLKLDDGTVLKGVVRLENIEGAEFGEKGYLLGDCCAWVKDIVPIPLTPEFLEKNGWKKFKRPYSSDYCYRRKDYPTLNIRSEKEVYFHWGDHDKSITTVHQLQHLFFGLGLKQEMEV